MNVHFDGIRYEGLAFLDNEQAHALDGVTVTADDVLLNITGASIGRVTTAPPELAGARVNQHVSIIRLVDGVVPSFVARWLASPAMQRVIADEESGATRQALTKEKIRGLQLPVAPLNEQRRIIAKLHAIFEQTRAAKARLERLPALLEKLKRSILAAAFRGDLTEDWRASHPELEPASALLDRIRAERRRRWDEGLRAKGKDPKKATYEEPAAVDPTDLPDLPAGWAWATVDELSDGARPVSYGVLKPGPFVAGGPMMFRIVDIDGGRLVHDQSHRVSSDLSSQYARTILQGGEVVISLVGSIGRTAVVDATCAGSNVHRNLGVIAPGNRILQTFLEAALSAPFAQGWIRSASTGGNQPLFNLGDLKRIPIATPSLAEQQIITEILRSSIDALAGARARIDTATESVARFDQAALTKAFCGELVPQDPSDEPASALLDRIRASRAAEPERPRRGRSQGGDDTAIASATIRVTNGYATNGHHDDSLDLVVAVFQQGEPRLTAADIADAANLNASAVKQVLKTLVAAGQIRVHGRARGTSYEWIA